MKLIVCEVHKMNKYVFYIKKGIFRVLKNFKNIRIHLLEYSHSLRNNKNARKSYLEAQILVLTHSLEKGLGLENTRVGYGKKKAEQLIEEIEKYMQQGYSQTSYVFLEAVRVMEVYLEYQRAKGVNNEALDLKVKSIKGLLNTNELKLLNEYSAGFTLYNKEELLRAQDFNFQEFISLRHSIRTYKPELIGEDIMRKVVEMANLAPSACNRQPIKVYCSGSREVVNETDRLITGNYGFKGVIPNYAIITCDRACFFDNEQFQWYVNGGIYLSYFTLALHSLGIGTLIMQWFPFYKTENILKKFYGISKNEAIVAIVGYGYYADEFKCICAQRKNIDETLILKKQADGADGTVT